MCFLQRLLVSLLLVILSACGGGSSSVEQSQDVSLSKSTADSEGGFNVPITNEVFGGNLLVDVNVSDLYHSILSTAHIQPVSMAHFCDTF